MPETTGRHSIYEKITLPLDTANSFNIIISPDSIL